MYKLFENEKIEQSVFLSVSAIPFDEKNREYCSANLCGKYGCTWNCPPAVGTFEECKKHAQSFTGAFVFTHRRELSDFNSMSEVNSLRNETMSILFEICEKLKNANVRFQPLGCGGCNECEICTYPDSPCRFPEKSVPPVESYGIDVGKLAERERLVYNAGKNVVTFFCIILFEELK